MGFDRWGGRGICRSFVRFWIVGIIGFRRVLNKWVRECFRVIWRVCCFLLLFLVFDLVGLEWGLKIDIFYTFLGIVVCCFRDFVWRTVELDDRIIDCLNLRILVF